MPLVRIAKPLLAFAPGTGALRVPHARAHAKTVATAALTIADVVQPHAKLLASAGLEKSFIAEMRHEARQLALAAKRYGGAREKRSRATASIAAEFTKAMKTLTVLEGLVMLHFARRPSMIELWRNRRRVTARIGRPTDRTLERRAASATLAEAAPPS